MRTVGEACTLPGNLEKTKIAEDPKDVEVRTVGEACTATRPSRGGNIVSKKKRRKKKSDRQGLL